eukprot:CAMPEP_0198491676 /NCGR_PEP_ID=MMETSP1462-20131121/2942_1 /TAXON_ID=1333877 /ORGANISM="Brandtodinium nutriculum, Strain RCC3387" /LENGTH=33 /DNA_ID= /DNA_START= /DNA_END= /DNA_ORIENTATION=
MRYLKQKAEDEERREAERARHEEHEERLDEPVA